ncbi:hypothetical protein KQY10_05560 [Leptospira interrogans]|uniref:Uncharacterized protein n=1 Tax=Leptospira interrogans serovar Hardjo str. Norma TaxID=1279460 RepID=A0A0M4N689_LEPIR|nr:hypothetical protein [Leptospira interrogans]ALE38014.1 hypothetical protein G436_0797 [Leptospira interrogans serovar Hardjo str. Norma]ALN99370.1 hypothetical protein LIH_03245 [Leptospira interrogans serovar Hardjo-prajitno]EKO97495.1 hypothetical protein LEP1GSC057_3055 [Leptospira interrogans str. Brem 329]MCD1165086.1 hypothetical protein [Leptospira interrogans]MCH1885338.1 hypothetical protein [Leptospira interrogans]
MKDYQAARDRINNHIRNSCSTLKVDLDLLARERARETFKLIKGWASSNGNIVPDFLNYIDFKDTDKKLGEAYRKYWHAVYIYRSFHSLIDNIVFSKILSLEYYFFQNNNILMKTGIQAELAISSQNTSQSLFYKSPLSHFLAYKVLTEILPKIQVTVDNFNGLQILPITIFDSFHRFESAQNQSINDFFELKRHMDSDPFMSQFLKVIDKK